jgi:rubredoxin
VTGDPQTLSIPHCPECRAKGLPGFDVVGWGTVSACLTRQGVEKPYDRITVTTWECETCGHSWKPEQGWNS